MSHRETRIKQRAYELWIQAGEPEGTSEQFWYQAEKEIDGDNPAASGKGAALTPDEELEKQLEETIPASDPPSATQP